MSDYKKWNCKLFLVVIHVAISCKQNNILVPWRLSCWEFTARGGFSFRLALVTRLQYSLNEGYSIASIGMIVSRLQHLTKINKSCCARLSRLDLRWTKRNKLLHVVDRKVMQKGSILVWSMDARWSNGWWVGHLIRRYSTPSVSTLVDTRVPAKRELRFGQTSHLGRGGRGNSCFILLIPELSTNRLERSRGSGCPLSDFDQQRPTYWVSSFSDRQDNTYSVTINLFNIL